MTDDAKALREQREAATGERGAALEGIGEAAREAPVKLVASAAGLRLDRTAFFARFNEGGEDGA